jgi:hypothetical protein
LRFFGFLQRLMTRVIFYFSLLVCLLDRLRQ